MPIKSNSKIIRKNEIKAELARIGPELFSSFPPARIPTENIRKNRFGLSLLVIAVFTAVVGMYIPTDKLLNRVMFVIAAFVLALVGAYHLDRANKELRNYRKSKSSK